MFTTIGTLSERTKLNVREHAIGEIMMREAEVWAQGAGYEFGCYCEEGGVEIDFSGAALVGEVRFLGIRQREHYPYTDEAHVIEVDGYVNLKNQTFGGIDFRIKSAGEDIDYDGASE